MIVFFYYGYSTGWQGKKDFLFLLKNQCFTKILGYVVLLTDDAKCWFYIFLEKGTFKLNGKAARV